MAEKDRVELLLEQIRSDVKGVAEGHSILHNKIDNLESKLAQKIDNLDFRLTSRIDGIAKDTKEIKQKLDAHIRLPAALAHAAV